LSFFKFKFFFNLLKYHSSSRT